MEKSLSWREFVITRLIQTSGYSAILFVALIFFFLLREGLPALSLAEMVAQGIVEYIDFPEALKGKYQSFTRADISALRAAGYKDEFATVEQGVSKYVEHLAK